MDLPAGGLQTRQESFVRNKAQYDLRVLLSLRDIRDCGDGTPCGRIAWIDPASADTTTDTQNPDPALRGRPLVGLQLLSSFERGRNRWQAGTIYDPESGKTYKSRLRRRDDGMLEVQGCIAFICQTQRWTASTPPPNEA